MRTRTLPILVAAVIPLAGCGLSDPYSPQPQKRPAAAAQHAPSPAPDEYPKAPNSAASVLARFAGTWANWSAATLAHQRAALLALATGRLAQQLREAVAQAVKTELQEVSRSYSRGRFIGLIADQGDSTLVLTYEDVAPLGGQAQSGYQLYLARTEQTPHGWRVSQWQPATDS